MDSTVYNYKCVSVKGGCIFEFITVITGYLILPVLFLAILGLNSGPYASKAGSLQLTPHLSPFLLWLF
jgi:hypothetical protein